MASTITRLTHVCVPVLGHIGITPQRQCTGCSGQALFQQDKLDLHRNLADDIVGALKEYNADVKSGAFLAEEHCYPMTHEELSGFLRTVDQEQPKVQQDIWDKRSTETTTGRSIKWTIK
ncbi:hypothetical protein BGZ58_002590 [Dissophora ornata]|nr:hypothetical protein BGZ58_002590 [Dissophora ornata]